MWTLAEAVTLIQEIEPLVRERNYHTLLAGGVLHTGQSDHDLDIWFIPLNGYESDALGILSLLRENWGQYRSLRDSPDYKAGEPWHLREMHRFEIYGKRVDVFIQ